MEPPVEVGRARLGSDLDDGEDTRPRRGYRRSFRAGKGCWGVIMQAIGWWRAGGCLA